jgi:hypothetical protein
MIDQESLNSYPWDPLHDYLYYHLEYGIGCYLPYVVEKTMVERCKSFT